MNPHLIHQLAEARHAQMLHEAEQHRLAGQAVSATLLSRVIARIPRVTADAREISARVAPTPRRS